LEAQKANSRTRSFSVQNALNKNDLFEVMSVLLDQALHEMTKSILALPQT